MNVSYWIDRKDALPDDGTVCVFHIKGRKAISRRGMSIKFGNYRTEWGFFDREEAEFYPDRKVDYWMPVPVLPGEDELCR